MEKFVKWILAILIVMVILIGTFMVLSVYNPPQSNETVVINTQSLTMVINTPPIPVDQVKKETTYTLLPYYIPNQYEVYVRNLCFLYGVPVDVFARMISKESVWVVKAVHRTYDDKGVFLYYDGMGLGQLNQRLLVTEFQWKFNNNEVIDPFDPYTNLRVSIRLLKWAYACSGNWNEALMIYNAGYGKWINKKIPDMTIDYVNAILYDPELRLHK